MLILREFDAVKVKNLFDFVSLLTMTFYLPVSLSQFLITFYFASFITHACLEGYLNCF